MDNIQDINNYIDSLEEELIKIRRDFHKYPESGWMEFRTASKIANYLDEIGLKINYGEEIFDKNSMFGLPEVDRLKAEEKRALDQGAIKKYVKKMCGGYTGVIGILDTEKDGPTTAFRFDIDANDCKENISIEHRPVKEKFSSMNKGVMHACGHDGHAAIGLILAKVLTNIKSRLIGKIMLIFQPAEEGVRGAYSIVNKGMLDDVDFLLCGHIGFQAKELGEIICNSDGFLATKKLDVIFEGSSSHAGATPEKGRNALLGAATAVLNLHTLCQHSEGIGRLNVGILNSGTGRNLVPENAEIKLETRGKNDNINDYISNRAIEVIKASASMYNLNYKIKLVGSAKGAHSDKELSNIVENQVKLIPEVQKIVPYGKLTGSEDATYMMNRVQKNGGKATYLMFGANRVADHHNNSFDFDEKVLKIGVKTYVFTAFKINNTR